MSDLARRSALVLGLLFGLLFAVGTGLLWYLDQPVWLALGFAFVVLGVQYLLAPVIIDYVFTIRWADPRDVSPEFAQWFPATCKSAGIRVPRFGIIDDGNPNAFAYGRTRADSRIVITSGLIDVLSPEELQAVVAHEIGHVAHRDFIVMTVAQAVPLALYILFVWTRRRSGNYGWLVAIGAYVVYILSQYIVLLLSRVRESFADQRSAVTTGDPNSLASALVKISYGLAHQQAHQKQLESKETKKDKEKESFRSTLSGSVTGAVSAMGIANLKSATGFAFTASDSTGAFSPAALANAVEWELKNPWARWFEVNSTHPLTGRRVRAMSDEAKRIGVTPLYEANSTIAAKEYTGRFAQELLVYVLPLVGALVGLGLALVTSDVDEPLRFAGFALAGYGVARLIKIAYVYPQVEKETALDLSIAGRSGSASASGTRTIESLVSEEINASHINGIPCAVEGKIIGRGAPGLFWSKDLVLRDDTGLIQLLYRQPLWIQEFWFGVSKAAEVVGSAARVYGWYRRAPVPYIEIARVELVDRTGRLRCYYKWGAFATAFFWIALGLVLLAWF